MSTTKFATPISGENGLKAVLENGGTTRLGENERRDEEERVFRMRSPNALRWDLREVSTPPYGKQASAFFFRVLLRRTQSVQTVSLSNGILNLLTHTVTAASDKGSTQLVCNSSTNAALSMILLMSAASSGMIPLLELVGAFQIH